jgi:hypothetical protein
MFANNMLLAAFCASLAAAAPMTEVLHERANLDLTVLQFALTLEHLENAFYKEALGNFSVGDFEGAGYSADYYNNIKYIAYDEQVHVTALTAAIKSLGAKPVVACSYKFPFTDVYANSSDDFRLLLTVSTARASPRSLRSWRVLAPAHTSAQLP